MARVGEVEKIVEGLVNRGLVAPKFVGRQVGQATIEELKNLGSSLATSQATRRNEDINRQFEFNKLQSQVKQPQITLPRPSNTGFDFTKPQIIGKTQAGTNPVQAASYTVLNPLGNNKFSLRTETGLADVIKNLSQGIDLNTLPELNTQFINSATRANVKSLEELQSTLANILKDPSAYQKLIGE